VFDPQKRHLILLLLLLSHAGLSIYFCYSLLQRLVVFFGFLRVD
jgi:hypothetical protein